MADPYSILGVSKGADEKAIKSAYRKLAKELHPDKNKDNPKASERFSEITQAYDLLSDPKKRGQFDRGEIDENGQPRFTGGNPFGGGGYSQGGPGGGNFDFGSGGIDLGDIFDGLFGGGGGRPGAGPRPQQAHRLPVPPPRWPADRSRSAVRRVQGRFAISASTYGGAGHQAGRLQRRSVAPASIRSSSSAPHACVRAAHRRRLPTRAERNWM